MIFDLLMVISIALIIIGGIFIYRESQKKNWIPTKGTIQHTSYKKVNPSGGLSIYGPGYVYRIFLKYQYNVMGGKYESLEEMPVSEVGKGDRQKRRLNNRRKEK